MSSIPKQRVNLLWVGIIVEGGLACMALVLAWFGVYDHSQVLQQLDGATFIQGVKWGLLGLIPMLAYLVLFHFWHPDFYQPMQETVDQRLRPMFASATLVELLLISILAGVGEELFFRWCVQGGISSGLAGTLGLAPSIGVGLVIASVLFGVCHWVNTTYAVVTFLVGVYLGGLMVVSGTWLAPAVAHAIFDFIALIYIVNSRPKT